MSVTSEQTSSITASRTRIVAIDALRGFAVCGILIVNIYQQVLARALELGPSAVSADIPTWVQIAFVGRFFPIFSTLFGVSFALFLESASRRSERPRWVLTRRLLILLAFGAVHWYFHPGEVLAMYALAGLIIAMPLSFVSPKVGIWISLALIVLPAPLLGQAGIPGLIGLGYCLGRLGLPRAMEGPPGRLARPFVVAVVLAGAGLLVLPQLVTAPMLGRTIGTVWALSIATTYAAGFLLLLHTPLRAALLAVFAPMGRMALSNYLGATLLMLTVGTRVGIDSFDDVDRIVALTVGINVFQLVFSALWLRWFAFGPMEWVWRCLTWWHIAPLRRRPAPAEPQAA